MRQGRRLLKLVFFSLLICGTIGLVLAPFQVSAENDFEINLMIAFPNLSFENPVDFQYADDGTNQVFVVGQEGVIWVFNNSASTSVATVFLNITDRVRTGDEEGLLGLAFHPDFNDTECFYVYYSAADEPRRSVIARYNVSLTDPNQADKESELMLLEILQPYSNHNGGQLSFGPNDGYLYIATGDGGSGGDPQGNAQNLTTLLGSILRIDVDNPANGENYSIPVDNPFVGNVEGYKEEIFAYGFRNPWRFSFDPDTGWLWVGDVGQSEREEIDIVEKGKNYGWNIKEGSSCFNPPSGCNSTGLVDPIWEY
ncbi:MAG: PQQ-dependent sugar dehydrogenase, partial [Candidatus Hodarchaeota archaeon]